jgi:hypothetical protein
LLIEFREIDRENRGKTEEPSIKTEIIEGKQRNQATKLRKTEEIEEKLQKTEEIGKMAKNRKYRAKPNQSEVEARSRCCGT